MAPFQLWLLDVTLSINYNLCFGDDLLQLRRNRGATMRKLICVFFLLMGLLAQTAKAEGVCPGGFPLNCGKYCCTADEQCCPGGVCCNKNVLCGGKGTCRCPPDSPVVCEYTCCPPNHNCCPNKGCCPSDEPHSCPHLKRCYKTITEAQKACGKKAVVCGVPVQ